MGDIRAEVEKLAFQIYQERGEAGGRELDDWLEAERRVKGLRKDVDRKRTERTDGRGEKVLRCREVGVDCDFEARGKTVEEVLKKAGVHARADHGLKRVTKAYLEDWRRHVHDA